MRRRIKKPQLSGCGDVVTLPANSAWEALGNAAKESKQIHSREAGPPGMGPAPEKVHEPGGDVIRRLKHPVFTTFERQWSKLPQEGWFSPNVNPSSPIIFELGSFTVPSDQALWLFDYEFWVARPSGIDAGDFQRAEAGRFSNQMGFDLTIGGNRPSDLMYELDPQPVVLDRSAFEPTVSRVASAGAFNRSAAATFALTAGPGTALLPVRRAVQGPENYPFTFVVGQGRVVALSCVIFNRIRAPLAAVFGRIAGYRLGYTMSEALVNRVRPQ